MNNWTTGVNGIPTNWAVQDFNPYLEEPLTFNIISSGTIYWITNSNSFAKTIEYSKNNGNWTSISPTAAGTAIVAAIIARSC